VRTLPRLYAFLLGLRWATLAFGTFLLSAKPGIENFPSRHLFVFIASFAAYQLAISVLQWKTRDKMVLEWAVVWSDVLCGILLVYLGGAGFFLAAVLIPIFEAFVLSDPGGIFVMIVDLIFLFPFAIQTQQLGARLLGGEVLLCGLFFWLFLLVKNQELEVERWQKKGIEEKKFLEEEGESSQKEIERLYHELLGTKDQFESLKGNWQNSVDAKNEEANLRIKDARHNEEEADRKYNDLLAELEESRKERQSLNFLVETSGHMHESLQMEETLVTVVETLGKVLPSQTTLIFLVEEEGKNKKLYAEVAASPYSDYFRNYNVEFGEGVVGWVAQTNEPVIIENGSLRTADGLELTTLLTNEKSAIVAPMVKKDGSPLGVIYLGEPEPHAFSWQDVNVLLRFIPHIQTAIAKARKYHEAIAQGIIDSLTSLHNRTYFEERLTEEVKRAYRYKAPLSLIYLQIDHYDHLMTQFDESVLAETEKEVAEMLRGYLRGVDVLAYMGEGRFAILLVQAERTQAVLISERIRLALEMRVFGETGKQRVKLTASIGVSGYSKVDVMKMDYTTARASLLSKCETGLQEAISKGGNKTCMAA